MSGRWLLGIAVLTTLFSAESLAAATALETAAVRAVHASDRASVDGTVEALRHTEIAAQVSGVIVALDAIAGTTVREGQVLARIDARGANQNVAMGQAQVEMALAALDVASRELARQRELYKKHYISLAALDRGRAEHRAAAANLAAQRAQASAAGITSDQHAVRAPYAGIIAAVSAELGDTAMPGKSLVSLYAPNAMRVTAAVPQSRLAAHARIEDFSIEFPGVIPGSGRVVPIRVQVMPAIDSQTHTARMRLDLPPGLDGVTPGMFARVWLPPAAPATGRLYIPATAIVRRAELMGVYVVGKDGRPVLRQVRIGAATGDEVEVLSGVDAGERVARDAQAAVTWR
ncbi:MAG TPA: efflux RND transporter periplasmic adaptor subunit [Candidimonas sp.]|nr:efflux RND transporter periplasmic adaptor subunit [Candidimonas sp.]